MFTRCLWYVDVTPSIQRYPCNIRDWCNLTVKWKQLVSVVLMLEMLHFCPYYGIDALMVDCPLLVVAFITDHVRSTKEGDVIGNIFSLFVCSQGPSGVPHGIWTEAVPWYLVLGPFLGSDGGAPDLVQVAGRRYPSQDQDRRPPGSGQGTPPPPPRASTRTAAPMP